VVDKFIQSFQSISLLASLEVLLQKHLFELLDGPIKDSDSDLVVFDIRIEVLLEVWMSLLEGLLNDIVLVRLHSF